LSGFSFDGPAVAYEAILPNFSSFKRPNEGGNVYVDGALKLDEWTAQDGHEAPRLCVPSWHTRLFKMGRNKPRGNNRVSVAAPIPFMAEWR
jgi:hypothetical protein